jgi:CheY-like chemotaxis protein
MMPVMDGFEFLQRLRSQDGEASHTPVIVVTAKDLDVGDRARLQGSVEDVIQKSGKSVESIMAEVREVLGTDTSYQRSKM